MFSDDSDINCLYWMAGTCIGQIFTAIFALFILKKCLIALKPELFGSLLNVEVCIFGI